MALSGFGQSPANRGKVSAWHKTKPEAANRPIEVWQALLALWANMIVSYDCLNQEL